MSPMSSIPAHKLTIDPHNDRIKLYGVTPDDLEGLEGTLTTCGLAGKIIAYALPGASKSWEALDFRSEGTLHGFFADNQDAHLWAAYPNPSRGREEDAFHHALVIQSALDRCRAYNLPLPVGYRCDLAGPEQAPEISSLMQDCFSVYPAPISAERVARAIEEGSSRFRVVRNRVGNIVAAASAEIDHRFRSAELTDCATRADQRGRGLMVHLLGQLVAELEGHYRLYSLARAGEAGINCVLRKLGFVYTGRLVNNCRMPTGWESMNVWCERRAA